MELEKFGAKYRDSIHFVENPLEESEVEMQALWEACAEMTRKQERVEVQYTVLQQSLKSIEEFLSKYENMSFLKRWMLTAQQKEAIREVTNKLNEIKPDLPNVIAEKEKLETEIKHVLSLLQKAEADWKKKLNS